MFPLNEEELEIHFLLKDLEDHKRNADKSVWMQGTEALWQGAQNRYEFEKTKYLERANDYKAKQYKETEEIFNKLDQEEHKSLETDKKSRFMEKLEQAMKNNPPKR